MNDEAAVSEPSQTAIAVQISPAQRWEVYRRLRSLGISCQYETGGSLIVRLDCPLATIQCWSALKQLTGTRAELISWLQGCWHQGN
ncbi:MAG: Asr1405/Asl0597 family protein [Cyanobacteria bacterium J06641_5]